MKNIIYLLERRGFINAMTGPELRQLADKPMKVYVGFDPTSDSLHIGNLVGIMGLAWFQRAGHTPVAVLGGATGMIGDPSGKSIERNLLDAETVERNIQGITRSLRAVLDFDHQTAKPIILNNHDWYEDFKVIEFLREVGKHFRMGPMLSKESVKSRLETDEGMSFTEFSYQLLQAYDFLYLYDHYGVTLQMGGSDQWGNITSGTELVRKMRQKTVYGLTFPLLTRSDGKKFGKTEEGAIWLNSDKLSSYDFYQYFYGIPDADVIRMMCMLTFIENDEITEISQAMHSKNYVPNSAQVRLAEEITRLIHGEKGLKQALEITGAAKPGKETTLDKATLEALSHELPTKVFAKEKVIGETVLNLFVLTDFLPSKSEARRMLAGGGIYLNNQKIVDEKTVIIASHLIEHRYLLLGKGKKKKMIVQVEM